MNICDFVIRKIEAQRTCSPSLRLVNGKWMEFLHKHLKYAPIHIYLFILHISVRFCNKIFYQLLTKMREKVTAIISSSSWMIRFVFPGHCWAEDSFQIIDSIAVLLFIIKLTAKLRANELHLNYCNFLFYWEALKSFMPLCLWVCVCECDSWQELIRFRIISTRYKLLYLLDLFLSPSPSHCYLLLLL